MGILPNSKSSSPDVVLIGAGIMSATLGVFLKELNPSFTIEIYELLENAGLESSDAWNNAGTGHAANCELNYTPLREDGGIDISKALDVNTEFDLSRQLWSYLVKKGAIEDPKSFIHPVPHMSFVRGGDSIEFLKKRYEALKKHHCYADMEYTEEKEKLKEWVPLIMRGRSQSERVAATKVSTGTDVNYGALTRNLIKYLREEGACIHYRHEVVDLERNPNRTWQLKIKDHEKGIVKTIDTPFVFVGAGGGSLELLQKSKIPEIKGYAGFPVSGLWLRCDDAEIANQHHAKVYGRASVGSPPMSVPHLDTRIVEGKRSLLFGPYAGFSTKFLKNGSLFDFFSSINPGNIRSLMTVACDNLPLTKYLVSQVLQSFKHRFQALQEFYPTAHEKDWKLEVAGQRVQTIKPDLKKGAILEFGTELIFSGDRSLVGLLGASPGASTAAFIAIHVLENSFPDKLQESFWRAKLKEIIPSYGESLIENAELCRNIRAQTAEILKL